jgi:hypothetical protein
MRSLILPCAAAILSSVFCGALRATETGQPNVSTLPVMTPLVADVLAAPHAVLMSDGHNHLVYELRLSNGLDGRFDLCPTSAPVGQIEGLHERRMTGSS